MRMCQVCKRYGLIHYPKKRPTTNAGHDFKMSDLYADLAGNFNVGRLLVAESLAKPALTWPIVDADRKLTA